MRKEIMVSAPTKKEAMKALADAFDDYIKKNKLEVWKWLIKPEAKERSPGRWRAYGRIEFDR